MSRLSIYETRWIDLIFENKNQEYGAYQLRRDSVKSSLTALLMGLLFVASIGELQQLSVISIEMLFPPFQFRNGQTRFR